MLANYFKKRPLSSKNKKRGFAVSGMLYPLLILMLFLVVQILFMMQTRKNVLDKSQKELSDTVNTSNTIYNNEELSTLIQEQAKIISSQKDELAALKKTVNDNKNSTDQQINDINSKFTNKKKDFAVTKYVTGDNYTNTKIVVNFGRSGGPEYVEIKLYGQYAYINYGGYVNYNHSSFASSGFCHGGGGAITSKAGNLGGYVTAITPVCSIDSDNNMIVTYNITLNSAAAGFNGSSLYADVTIHDGYGLSSAAKVTMP